MCSSFSSESISAQYCRKIVVVGSLQQEELNALAKKGWAVDNARTIDEANIRLGEESCVIVLVALSSLDARRLSAIRALAYAHDRHKWLALVDRAQIGERSVRELLGECFWDYCTRPVGATRLVAMLGHAMGMAALGKDRSAVEQRASGDYGIIGESPAAVGLRETVEKVAGVDAPVLVAGETGAGKELVARAIHAVSRRRDGPFEAVNCAALPPTLIHAELFGHEKGAFTGAHARKIGRFECANTGTLFLDEIGDLPESLQTLLLRFLEQRVIRRVGGIKDLPVDVRIISATHVNLSNAIQEGRFREDLYYRLEVLGVRVPALRKRGDDVLLLANHFLREFADEIGKRVQGFAGETERVIAAYRWPGNVRELLNRVYRAVVMCDKGLIYPQDLGFGRVRGKVESVVKLDEARAQAEQDAIKAALHRFDGDTKVAAKALGVSRATLYRMMNKLNIGQQAG